MAGLLEIANEVRLDPVKCPHCGRLVRTGGFIKALFERLVERALGGERIEIVRFGTFELREMAGRSYTSKIANIGDVSYGARLVLRFRQSRILKARLKAAALKKERKQ